MTNPHQQDSDYHELLMAYGKACAEDGYLSARLTQIRMDLATLHLIEIDQALARYKQEVINQLPKPYKAVDNDPKVNVYKQGFNEGVAQVKAAIEGVSRG